MENHFEGWELECHCDKCRGTGTEANISSLFWHRLNLLRDMWGDYIHVSNAYRCPERNMEVGGVEDSQHLYGKAADIYVDGGYEEYKEFVNTILVSELFDAVGEYDEQMFVHVDIREDGNNPNYYRWKGI